MQKIVMTIGKTSFALQPFCYDCWQNKFTSRDDAPRRHAMERTNVHFGASRKTTIKINHSILTKLAPVNV